MAVEDSLAHVAPHEKELASLRVLLGNAPGFLAHITTDLRFIAVNRIAPGLAWDALEGRSILEHIAPADRAVVSAAVDRAISTREVQWYSTMGTVSQGRLGYYLGRVNPVVEDGVVRSLVLLGVETTEIQEDRALVKLALEATGMGVWTMDVVSGTGTWDAATRSILGGEGEHAPDFAGVVREHIHEDDRAFVERTMQRALETGVYGPIDHRVVLNGGRIRWVSASGIGIRGDDGRITRIVGAVRDVTERRVLEARLVESEKLESIGRLAGGVAHDFNNMLTAIMGSVALAQASLPDDSPARALLDEVKLAADRSAALTDQLLTFARRTRVAPETVALADVVRRVEPLIRRALGEHVVVKLACESEAAVHVDPAQLEQILMNLVTNARDAMPDGGRVTIAVRDRLARAHDHPELDEGPHVELSVSDTGHGIAKEVLPHVFEPFYTTKAHGTGLGLATCYGIARQAGAAMRVESDAAGSTFRVIFPRRERAADEERAAAPAPAAPKPAPPRDAPSVKPAARVLVVEDEPLVRAAIERALRLAGFFVESASDAKDAIARAERGAPFDVVVTDVVMPGQGGPALVRALRALRPELPALFITGYAEGDILPADDTAARSAVLEKPFVPDTLVRAVRALLSPSGARTTS